MKSKIIIKTSIYNVSKEEMFKKLQEIKTLQYIAFPYATFKEIDGRKNIIWKKGEEFNFKFKLFGFIPFGIHEINIVKFDINKGIYTCEKNKYVTTWNHEIILKEIDDKKLQYTDKVEINAGWKTIFVFWWANLFYSYRQRKWQKLLK